MSDELKEELENKELEDAIEISSEAEQDEPVELDSPLVVHKKGDASYQESSVTTQMSETHTEDDGPTLTRHRFRKEQKGHNKGLIFLFVLVIAAAAIAALYFTGNLSFSPEENTTAPKAKTTEITTSLEDKYKGTIVVKDVYIFVDGIEVQGIEGLQNALEYEDKSTTAYTIIDENANSDFFNFEVLELLTQLGFYGKDTKTEHIASTGLIAEAETTTAPTTTTTKKSKSKSKSKSKTTQSTTKSNNG